MVLFIKCHFLIDNWFRVGAAGKVTATASTATTSAAAATPWGTAGLWAISRTMSFLLAIVTLHGATFLTRLWAIARRMSFLLAIITLHGASWLWTGLRAFSGHVSFLLTVETLIPTTLGTLAREVTCLAALVTSAGAKIGGLFTTTAAISSSVPSASSPTAAWSSSPAASSAASVESFALVVDDLHAAVTVIAVLGGFSLLGGRCLVFIIWGAWII